MLYGGDEGDTLSNGGAVLNDNKDLDMLMKSLRQVTGCHDDDDDHHHHHR